MEQNLAEIKDAIRRANAAYVRDQGGSEEAVRDPAAAKRESIRQLDVSERTISAVAGLSEEWEMSFEEAAYAVLSRKEYMDIQNLREEDEELKTKNCEGFSADDHIQITEKFDGSNASACYNEKTGRLMAFSRSNPLYFAMTLSGFWNYTQGLPEETVAVFAKNPSYRVFGEWNSKNRIIYNDTGKVQHWYIFDIYDREKEEWLPQAKVKAFCEEAGLEYVHELYNGPFVSWEHVRGFLHSPAYGESQEGVVIKNQDKLNKRDSRRPFYLKIVNENFAETKKSGGKAVDPEAEAARAAARTIVEEIVTRNRVEKAIYKLRDEGVLPEKITPADMKLVAQNLPKYVYADCIKEEIESVKAAGEYFSKMCAGMVMKHAKDILSGEEG